MNEIIWYCLEDGLIFPNEEEARKAYKHLCDKWGEEYDEVIFSECYSPITFLNYNKEELESENGYFKN